MAIKDIPSQWNLRLALPDKDDPREITEAWDLVLDGPIEYVAQEYSFKGPISVKVRGHWVKPEFYLEIGLEALVEVPCSRCLEPVSVALNDKFGYLYGLSNKNEEDTPDSGDQNYIKLPFMGALLDVTQQVWDSLILTLPANVLCSEDCQGLCPVCGQNLNYGKCECRQDNMDPRLEIFRDMKTDIDKDQK